MSLKKGEYKNIQNNIRAKSYKNIKQEVYKYFRI
jgi:hypothetical protein